MYSPKINEELVKILYQLKQVTGRPITKQANEAIAEYINKQKASKEVTKNERA